MNNITKQDIEQGYMNLKKAIDVLLERHDIQYKTTNDAPNTYRTMIDSRESKGYYIVYNGGDHGMLGEEYNIKFRALHDWGHYSYGLSFRFYEEKRLGELQALDLALVAWNDLGLTTWESYVIREIVKAEIIGQIDYFQNHGKYVADQSEFITNYFGI